MSEVEHETVMFPLNPELQTRIQEKVREGWDMQQGTVPMVVYHLVRTKGQVRPAEGGTEAAPAGDAIGGRGEMHMNEDLIFIEDKYGRRRKISEDPYPEPSPEEAEKLLAEKKERDAANGGTVQ